MHGGSLLHWQISELLRERIEQGTFPPGSRMPSERSLSAQFGVSRPTVRQALSDLEEDGQVEVIGGIRWVARREGSIEEGATGLVSFSALAKANGLTVDSTVITHTVRPSTLDEADILNIAPGAAVIDLVRLRHLDGIPVVVDYSLIPEAIAPGIEDVDFSTESLYGTLAERFGLHAKSAECVIEARGASSKLSELLGLKPGDPVLEIIQLVLDEEGRVMHSGRSVYRGDRYRFRAKLETSRGARGAVNRVVEQVNAPPQDFAKVLR